MKHFKNISSILAIILLLTSCTTLIYSHQDYMDKFKTKDDVIRSFGVPHKKAQEGNYTEWQYNYHPSAAMGGRPSHPPLPFSRRRDSSASPRPNTDTTAGLQSKNYVKFLFDDSNRVVSWNSQGVDFSKREVAPGKTTALVLGSVAAGLTVIIIIVTAIVGALDKI